MLSPNAKKEIFDHLMQIAIKQRQVRDCEIEGTVYAWEDEFDHAYSLGLIDAYDLDRLIDRLKPEDKRDYTPDGQFTSDTNKESNNEN
jgi:hypothetical protein